MAFTPLPDTVKLELVWRIDGGQTAVNVLHGNAGGSPVPADIDGLVADLLTAMATTDILASMSDQTELVSIIATDITVANGYQARNDGTLAVGADTGAPLPNEVALVTTLRTATNSRRGRGRVFWPGFGEAASLGQRATDPTLGNVQATCADIQAAFLGNSMDWAVASYMDGDSKVITTYTTQERWDSQRRRRIPGL